MLPSGLPEIVGDDEKLARFLTQTSHYTATMVKPSAFLPHKTDRETSVFRHDVMPVAVLWALAKIAIPDRPVYAAAIISVARVREELLEVISAEPPDRHAVINDWPHSADDPVFEKARHKQIAQVLCGSALLVRPQ